VFSAPQARKTLTLVLPKSRVGIAHPTPFYVMFSNPT
jgi:hypothetical protein